MSETFSPKWWGTALQGIIGTGVVALVALNTKMQADIAVMAAADAQQLRVNEQVHQELKYIKDELIVMGQQVATNTNDIKHLSQVDERLWAKIVNAELLYQDYLEGKVRKVILDD